MQPQTTGKERVLGALARMAAGELTFGLTIYLGRIEGYVLAWTRLHPAGEVDEFRQATSFLGASILGASVTPPVSKGSLPGGGLAEIARALEAAPFELREPAEPLRPSASPHRLVVRLESPGPPPRVDEVELLPPLGDAGRQAFEGLAEQLQAIAASAGRAPEPPRPSVLFEDELTVAGDASEVLAHLSNVDDEKTFAGGPGGPFGQVETARQLARSLLSDVARTHAPALERARREGRDPRAAVAAEVAEAWRTFSHLVPVELHAEFGAVAREVLLAKPGPGSR